MEYTGRMEMTSPGPWLNVPGTSWLGQAARVVGSPPTTSCSFPRMVALVMRLALAADQKPMHHEVPAAPLSHDTTGEPQTCRTIPQDHSIAATSEAVAVEGTPDSSTKRLSAPEPADGVGLSANGGLRP